MIMIPSTDNAFTYYDIQSTNNNYYIHTHQTLISL